MDYQKCLSRLQRLCSRAEYYSADIYRKALRDLDGDEAAAASVVESLVKDRYVDDARYCSAYAREKASIQGWGPVKIRYQLRSRGVSEQAIREGLGDIDEESASRRLQKLLMEKKRTLDGDPMCKLKLIRFALSRGYEYGDVAAAVDQII